ncbi:MAG: TetR/AcrR family transcriptional regulator [Burkholderiaceae bacterium]|nr:TetR/AcrR family transcriptional regulator [Burkholderiaceae bacterium]
MSHADTRLRSAGRPLPRQRRKSARPHELLEAALTLFVEKGFAATRADEVARQAGVSKGTLYRYYPSKEELLKAVMAHYLSARIAASAEAVRRIDGPMAPALREMLVAWWRQTYASPASGTFKLIISEVRNFPDIAEFYVREVIEPGHQLVGAILQRGIASGEFRTVDVESAVHSLLLPMVMLCTHKHALGACTPHSIDAAKFIADHVELVLTGLLQTEAEPRRAIRPIKSR